MSIRINMFVANAAGNSKKLVDELTATVYNLKMCRENKKEKHMKKAVDNTVLIVYNN